MYPLSYQARHPVPLPMMSHSGRHMVWPAWDPPAAASHQQYCWRAGTHSHHHRRSLNFTYSIDGKVRLDHLLLLKHHGRHKLPASMGSSAEAVPTSSAEVVSHFFLIWGKVRKKPLKCVICIFMNTSWNVRRRG